MGAATSSAALIWAISVDVNAWASASTWGRTCSASSEPSSATSILSYIGSSSVFGPGRRPARVGTTSGGLDAERVRLRRRAGRPARRALQWLHRSGLVNVQDDAELVGQARLGPV